MTTTLIFADGSRLRLHIWPSVWPENWLTLKGMVVGYIISGFEDERLPKGNANKCCTVYEECAKGGTWPN